MAKKISAGILLYRKRDNRLEVLLVHPGGPYFRTKDIGSWSIPKGLVDEQEDKLAAAKREFFEETGSELHAEHFIELSPVTQNGGKIVFAWGAEGNIDADAIRSNTFSMEYPYKSGKWIEVPEIDKAEWFDIPAALEKILASQVAFINELETIIRAG